MTAATGDGLRHENALHPLLRFLRTKRSHMQATECPDLGMMLTSLTYMYVYMYIYLCVYVYVCIYLAGRPGRQFIGHSLGKTAALRVRLMFSIAVVLSSEKLQAEVR